MVSEIHNSKLKEIQCSIELKQIQYENLARVKMRVIQHREVILV